MFCVIQEVELKKPNTYGYSKELQSYFSQMSYNGEDWSHYAYKYSEERFERLIKKAYKISIHESYREDGKIKKKQCVIFTVNYYDFATDIFTLDEWCGSVIDAAAVYFNTEAEIIYEILEAKLNPLIESIQEEFRQTEEYITHEKHEEITTIYALKKAKFNNEYGTSGSEYDQCYDVFGELRNPQRLKEIIKEAKAREEYEEKSRSYQENFYSNYNKYFSGGGGGSYCNNNQSNYNSDDKETLKQFYRVLSKKFHPDANPDKDTSKEMKLLNQLKVDWNI